MKFSEMHTCVPIALHDEYATWPYLARDLWQHTRMHSMVCADNVQYTEGT
jgi:hypothetical protein